MFFIVTVEAQQLPVAAILWIVIVIVVLVMHRQTRQRFAAEYATAAAAQPGK